MWPEFGASPSMDPVEVDVLVVGGGPIGLATAVEAAQAGMTAAVVERRGAVVDKACGEGLMPAAREGLERLGVVPDGCEFRGIRYVAPGSSATALFRRGPGLGVRRTALSAALGHRVDALGIKRVTAAAEVPALGPDWVEAGGVRARWLVAADGLHSPVRRALGLGAGPDGGRRGRLPARYGLRRHYRVEPWTDLVEVHWSHGAEAYVTPVAPDLVGVAVLSPGGAPFDRRLAEFPQLVERLSGAAPVGEVRGAGPLRQRASRRTAGRVLLVGDAAGYVDALTGEGISVGLACARELVACLLRERPQDYEAAWRRATRRYRVITGSLLWAASNDRLRGAVVPAAQRLPWVFSRVVDQLG